MIRFRPASVLVSVCVLVAGAWLVRPTVAAQGGAPAAPVPLDKLTLPKGFKISVFAEGVRSARAMALGAKGTVFVGSMSARAVYALVDKNGDGVADEVKVIASNVRTPAGVVFHDGSLFFSTVTQIFRLDDIENHLDTPPAPVAVGDPLPNNTGHKMNSSRIRGSRRSRG
jgi:glucose/arabinose dehydrogenase